MNINDLHSVEKIMGRETDTIVLGTKELIMDHNLLCDILSIFNENKIAQEYFEESIKVNTDNYSIDDIDLGTNLGTIYKDALDSMLLELDYYKNKKETRTQVDNIMLSKENRKLKSKIDFINSAIEKYQQM